MTTTAITHTNIALMKYWGKRDRQWNIPTTSSLSLTLDEFYTETTAQVLDTAAADIFCLNGERLHAPRLDAFMAFLRQQLGAFPAMAITSTNHVPTSAGLASSASGFSALTGAVVREAGHVLSLTDLSRLARCGSGSASRSFFPDFAIWHAGTDHLSSYAEPLNAPAIPIAMVVATVTTAAKSISSTTGMQRAQTSPDYSRWVSDSRSQFTDMVRAVHAADIEKIGTLAEANARAMHALNQTACDSPFTYLTADSQRILALVERLRQQGVLAFATMDAGPNVKIITQLTDITKITTALTEELPHIAVTTTTSGPGIRYAN